MCRPYPKSLGEMSVDPEDLKINHIGSEVLRVVGSGESSDIVFEDDWPEILYIRSGEGQWGKYTGKNSNRR